MRLNKARIEPVGDAEMTPEQREALQPFIDAGKALNIFRTIARKPKALRRFNEWGGYVLSRRNDLPVREREIAILRTGWLCRSGYEWTQHLKYGRSGGLGEADFAALKAGADAGWGPADAALIRACVELHADQFITDATWAELRRHFTEAQCMDVVFTAGNYTLVSMILNSFGVQLEPGATLDPDFKRSGPTPGKG